VKQIVLAASSIHQQTIRVAYLQLPETDRLLVNRSKKKEWMFSSSSSCNDSQHFCGLSKERVLTQIFPPFLFIPKFLPPSDGSFLMPISRLNFAVILPSWS
jgi:hypothetical protein